MTPEDAADAVSPGTTALVIGSSQRRRDYCRHSLGTANQAAAVVLPETSADIETVQASGGAPVHQVVVTDRELTAGSDTTCIRIDSRSVPAVGEAGLAVLAGEESPPVDRLWLATPPTSFAPDLQKSYRLLYVLTQRIREQGAIAWFVLDSQTDQKTRRILGRAVDYEITVEKHDTAVRSLASEEP